MASRNGFRVLGSVAFTALLASFVLSGCAPSGAEVAMEEGHGTEATATATTPFTPESNIADIASTAGNGTAVSFPDSTQPSFADPVPGADRMKVYGSPFYRTYGDNNAIPTNIAEAGEEEKNPMEELSQVPPGAKSFGTPITPTR